MYDYISKEEQIQINKAIGQSFEDACFYQLAKSYDSSNIKQQVTLYYKDKAINGTIKSFRPDFIIYKSETPIYLVEAKSSLTARFTKNQHEGYPAVANGDAYYDEDCTISFPTISTIVMYPSDSDPQTIEQIQQNF